MATLMQELDSAIHALDNDDVREAREAIERVRAIINLPGAELARIKWFNRERGFGFLTRGEGTPDIFLHMETLRRFGIREPTIGQCLVVRHVPGPRGLTATEVHLSGTQQ